MSVTFSRPSADLDADPYVNMANGNAADVLRFLGLPDEPAGEIRAADLARRAGRKAMHVVGQHPGDGGRMRREERVPGGCTIIEMEREPGYLRSRAAALQALAVEAIEHDGPEAVITWG